RPRPVRARDRPGERPRPARRGVRRPPQTPARQLPAGVQPPGPDLRGARDRGGGGARRPGVGLDRPDRLTAAEAPVAQASAWTGRTAGPVGPPDRRWVRRSAAELSTPSAAR